MQKPNTHPTLVTINVGQFLGFEKESLILGLAIFIEMGNYQF